jgi:DNA-binding XRE family transcriptional regulator
MSRPLPRSRKWIEPQDFRDLRRQSGLTRKQAASELDVTSRTIQNWETGGARIPWMAFRMLRILSGISLPGRHWEGWTVRGRELIAPNGRSFDSSSLEYFEQVFSQARLWRQMYAASGRTKTASTVLPFPDRRRIDVEPSNPLQNQLQRMKGTR